MESQHKVCPSCSKSYERFKGITWAFGPYCSRRCQDIELVQWLNTQYCQYEEQPVEKKVD